MMSRAPKPRWMPLLVMSVLAVLLGIAVAMTYANSETWKAQWAALTNEYPAPSLGMTFDRDLRVIDLVPGGAAERKGVKLGDVVIAVNRATMNDANQLYQLLQNEDATESLRLGLLRENNKMDVIVQPVLPTSDAGRTP